MMKYLILFALLSGMLACQQNEGLEKYEELNAVLLQKDSLEHQKELALSSLAHQLTSRDMPLAERYYLLQDLQQAYFSFQYDSAVHYALEMQEIAMQMADSALLQNARIKTAATLLRAGMFLEVKNALGSLYPSSLPDSLRTEYFYTKAILYFDLLDKYQQSLFADSYRDIAIENLRLAISTVSEESLRYHSLSGLLHVKLGDYHLSAHHYNSLFANYSPQGRQLAIDASTCAWVYAMMGDREKQIDLLLKAAITDVLNVNKENLALLNIGNLLFEDGEVDLAGRYLKIALNDARDYGAELRQDQLAEIIPSVEAAKVNLIQEQKDQITLYAVIASVLTIGLIVVLILLFKQLRHVSEAKAHVVEVNEAMQHTNKKLREENIIKEEYIGFSFKTSSDLIQKLDDVRQDMENKLRANKIEELKNVLNRGVIKKERDKFFDSFDSTFLSIFPEFVQQFNALFDKENAIIDDTSKTLSTELRIFALIRLGIYDSERISQILNYSINTINTYKTKVKNRSFVSNDDFENEIRKIESI